MNWPPAGFRDAPTQENQATTLARTQTAASNASPGLKKSHNTTAESEGIFIFI